MYYLKDVLNLNSISNQIKNWGKAGPFDHVVIDNFFLEPIAKKLSEEFPDFDSEVLFNYDSAIEIKKSCNNWHHFPPLTYKVFSLLNEESFLKFLSETLLKGQKLFADNGLNGGGWHIHKRGGKLNTHLDYSVHQKLGLQRKLNIIVYMNPNWKKNWGGALGFWGNESPEKPGELVQSVWSKFNRAVIFDTTQNSWHGLPEPLKCPEGEYRKSLAAYYLCEPKGYVDERGKALFAPSDGQEADKEVLDLIIKRSKIETASEVWNTKK